MVQLSWTWMSILCRPSIALALLSFSQVDLRRTPQVDVVAVAAVLGTAVPFTQGRVVEVMSMYPTLNSKCHHVAQPQRRGTCGGEHALRRGMYPSVARWTDRITSHCIVDYRIQLVVIDEWENDRSVTDTLRPHSPRGPPCRMHLSAILI